MNLSAELARIRANQPEESLGRILPRAEVEMLQAAGAITLPALIPRERCYARVSVPESRSSASGYHKRGSWQ